MYINTYILRGTYVLENVVFIYSEFVRAKEHNNLNITVQCYRYTIRFLRYIVEIRGTNVM